PCAIAVEDRAAFETERHFGGRSLERRARPDERTLSGLGLSQRHDADAARDVDGFELAIPRKPSERPADRLDLGRVRRSDGCGAKGEGHVGILGASGWSLVPVCPGDLSGRTQTCPCE